MAYYIFIENGVINGKGQARIVSDGWQSIETTKEIYDDIEHYMWDGNSIVLDPDYEEKQARKRQDEFETEFFETSLGWIRREVHMANGSTKDFLSDLLPAISMALNSGTATQIITYTLPDFTHDITDWTIYQEIKTVTPQFIQDCFNQLSTDFGAI